MAHNTEVFIHICKLRNQKLMSRKICKRPARHRYRMIEFYQGGDTPIL